MVDVHFLAAQGQAFEAAQSRMRMAMDFAQNHGKRCVNSIIPLSTSCRMGFLARLGFAHTIVIHDFLFSKQELWWLSKRCKQILFDYSLAVPCCHDGFAYQCSQSRICVTSNIETARTMSLYCPVVRMAAGGVDVESFVPRQESDPSSPLQVGFIGMYENTAVFDTVLLRLKALAGPVQFQIISDKPYTGPCHEFVFWEKYSKERLGTQIQAMDVGLIPLTTPDCFNGTIAMQLLQLMACGIAPVASCHCANADIIDHGVDGFLVNSLEEWNGYVMRLLDAPGLRHAMGENAREKIVSKFTHSHFGALFWST